MNHPAELGRGLGPDLDPDDVEVVRPSSVLDPVAALPSPFDKLTAREIDVARRIAAGDNNREIAKALGIAVKTYDTHRRNLMHKLNARHNVDVARAAIRVGLVQP